jgi:hypothetical protein
MKVLLIIGLLSLTGCGRFDRWVAGWTGDGAKTCVDGVLYLQFTSGTSVAYNPDGSIKKCEE